MQQLLLNPDALQVNQSVTIETADGEKISGVVCMSDSNAVLIVDKSGKETALLLSNVVSIKGPHPVLDNNGVLVSKAEIDSFRTDTNLKTYAIVGGIISGGMGFIAGNLMSYAIGSSDYNNNVIIYIGTMTGLTTGGILFATTGARHDREKAIEHALLSRAAYDYKISLPDQKDDILLRNKIQEMVNERQKIEKEIEQLLDELGDVKEPQETHKSE